MNTILRTFLLAFSVCFSGCWRTRQGDEHLALEKEPPPMIKVKDLTVTDETLTLDYQVSNPFDDDIRVCHSAGIYGNRDIQRAARRIEAETLWIKLRRNIKRDGIVFRTPPGIAKYFRLAPGESYSGRILLDLPARDYSRESWESPQEHKEVVLHRAVFEVGYFGADHNKFFDAVFEELKKQPVKPELPGDSSFHRLTFEPLIAEELQDGQMREVTYISEYWPNLRDEESAQVLITDVNIPCSVVVDNK